MLARLQSRANGVSSEPVSGRLGRPATRGRPLNTRSTITILSLMVLVGTEVFAVAIAAGWAVAGLLELGEHVGYGLMAAFSLFAAWIMLHLWRRATSIEPVTARSVRS